MTVPQVNTSSQTASKIPTDVLVIGVVQAENGPRLTSDGADFGPLRESLAAMGVTGAPDEVRRVARVNGPAKSLALVGLGREPVSADALRYAAGSAVRQITGVSSLVIDLPATTEVDLLAVLEGAAIGGYSYTAYRSVSADTSKLPAPSVTVISPDGLDSAIVERARAVAGAVHSVRDLVNMPALDLYPESFADAVGRLSTDLPVELTVLGNNELIEGGFGGIVGVGQGSTRGPRLVKISYSPQGAARHVALVGKGITFDTGGLSLKQPSGMVGMKYDMTGAATVMAVVLAAARLSLDVRLTAWLCIAENMPSGSAIRPNDVLRIRNGKTVEVLNTDAEGRLVMADGLSAASEEYPDAIIDVATLTGAARVALGNRYAGAMGDPELVGRVVDAATRAGELLWPMPLPAELRALLNSDVADLTNAKIGNTAGGMLLAGTFLKEFIGPRKDNPGSRIPWAHLDIAGPANNASGGYGFTGKGATGVMVRALIRFAEEFSRP
ncbi:MAG: leucyl aminopeptidase [Lacisediminihabitans sp.]